MKHLLLPLLCLASCTPRIAQNNPVHQSADLTAMNIFSRNIEGPCFDKNNNLYIVNYLRDGTVGKLLPNNEMELFIELPNGSIANSIQFTSKGNMLLADFINHNILEVDMHTKAIRPWVHDNRFNQPNDICINTRDQVFATDPNWKQQTGQLWRADANGSLHLLESNMGTTNGICLSPDEKHLYVNESIQRRVWRYNVDAAGNISNKTLFTSFTDHGLDGMKCDSKGNVYITRYGKGVIAVISPAGELLREITLTGKNCSNLVFGGKNKRTVYVTLQDRKGMEYFLNDVPGK
ncbi:MAG TPA: SMP-30/gluconolactonase/LRE family protein [Chitinophagaceae bacterium]|nr:SMP-30/gluconolactonase/LRE family protein [Chitinophagaceae bacterium]